MERTFVCIKPESVRRCLVGKIIERFEAHGFRLIAIKMIISTRKQAADHYIGCSDQPFFPKVISYMTSGPVVAMIWEGVGVVKGIRKILGATPDKVPPPGTLRAEFRNNSDVGKYHDTVCHGSDSAEDAVREFAIWFDKTLKRSSRMDFERHELISTLWAESVVARSCTLQQILLIIQSNDISPKNAFDKNNRSALKMLLQSM
ncbi:hypothetical protein niasHS_008931 [Heterodera schachtii]|uniref:nucleoside-diphosphate kinase n=1 Tax=Heterodera schachtii TaxID=97005 RepID=A0ABD2J2F5_HETSC